MKYLILCGGRGERFVNGNPKPLNRICGKMLGYWMIKSLTKNKNITDIIWVLNPNLYLYNVESEIKTWSDINNIFVKLPFETRDASETLELALKKINIDESFICLDNDNIYIDGIEEFENLDRNDIDAAILVSMMKTNKIYPPRYGFLKVEDGLVIDGREKKTDWGENAISYGGYWFKNKSCCLEWLKFQKMETTINNGEKTLLNLIVKYSNKIKAVITDSTFSIGTPEDCYEAELNNSDFFGWKHSTIIIQEKLYNKFEIMEWIKEIEKKGATIKKSAERPIGDLHHDLYLEKEFLNFKDNAWMVKCGDYSKNIVSHPINTLPVTRNVSINMIPIPHVIKSGNTSELINQAFYYQSLNTNSFLSLKYLFPTCYDVNYNSNNISLNLEYIKGVPASYIWSYDLWGEVEWDLCVNSIKKIHNTGLENMRDCNITTIDILKEYIDKVNHRRKQSDIFLLLDDDNLLWNSLINKISDYQPSCVTYIHGDCFMGNIIFPMKGGIKFIDMKGSVNGIPTLFGDANYDWAKLTTSFLGMDSLVYNLPLTSVSTGLQWIKRLPHWPTIVNLSLVLMYGCISFYNYEVSAKIISRIKLILDSL